MNCADINSIKQIAWTFLKEIKMKNLTVVVSVITSYYEYYQDFDTSVSFTKKMKDFTEVDFYGNGEFEYIESIIGKNTKADQYTLGIEDFINDKESNALISRSFSTLEIIVKTNKIAKDLALFFNTQAEELVGFEEKVVVSLCENFSKTQFFEWEVEAGSEPVIKIVDIINSLSTSEGIQQLDGGNEWNLSFITECKESSERFKGMVSSL